MLTSLKQANLQYKNITSQTEKPILKQSDKQQQLKELVVVLRLLAFTMLGDAAGGGAFSFKNGSTRLGSDQTGYPLILP